MSTTSSQSRGTQFVIVATASLWGANAFAQLAAVPPCAGPANPDFAAVGEALNQRVWVDHELPLAWIPPACTGWSAGPTKMLLAGAGRFLFSGTSDVLAARLTRISSLEDVVYWSHSRGRWRNLIKDAAALSQPDRTARRTDFVASDFVADAELHYWLEEDNPTVGVVYQMRVRERTPARIIFEAVNLTAVRAKLLIFRAEIAAPGELRQLYYIERESDDTWRYYTLIRMGRASGLAGTSAANYRNRTEAYFRFLAGRRMDQEPPAAR